MQRRTSASRSLDRSSATPDASVPVPAAESAKIADSAMPLCQGLTMSGKHRIALTSTALRMHCTNWLYSVPEGRSAVPIEATVATVLIHSTLALNQAGFQMMEGKVRRFDVRSKPG